MNIFNRFFLYLVLIPSALYRNMGVNIAQLRAILNAKLAMDDRRTATIQQQKRSKNKPPKLATLGTMFMTAVMGVAFLAAFAVGEENDYVTQLTLYFSFYIFTLTSVLISDFTSVLIDVRDNMILLPKPINDRTFVLARLLHIVIHVTKMVLPMTLPGIIYIAIRNTVPGMFAFLFVVLSATLFIIFLINAIYLLILKITTPEKFKNIISYFQIFFAISFYAGYQILPRLIGKTLLSSYSIQQLKYPWMIVSYWFAAGWKFLESLSFKDGNWIFFLLIVLLPVASIWTVVKYFAPSFNAKLSMISGSEGGEVTEKVGKTSKKNTTSGYIKRLAQWFTIAGPERVSFLQTWKITGRSRDFKMKVYPSIGYIAVYIVLIFFQNGKFTFAKDHSQFGFMFLTLVYFSSFILMVALTQVSFSDKYKAAWIYYVTPISKPGHILSGTLKAMMVKFYMPIIAGTVALALLVSGVALLPNLLLAIFNQCLIISLVAYIMMRELPFSMQPTTNVKGGGFLRGLLSMLVPLCVAVLHFFVYKYTVVVLILCALSGIAAWYMMDSVKNKSWEKVRITEYE